MAVRPVVRSVLSKVVQGVLGRTGGATNPFAQYDAVVVILLGQSLNASRGTQVLASDWAGAYMPVDGVAVQDFSFYSNNNDNPANYASFASASALAEGASGQSPCVGIGMGLANSGLARAYIVSLAVGSRDMATMMSRGMRPNLYAAAYRLRALAIAAGYNPCIVFYSAHGEADAAAATGETTYYDRAMAFYKGAQLAAAQAMDNPSYVAPVILSCPLQTNAPSGSGANDRAINKAIVRVANDLPGAMLYGGIYSWAAENDRVHPTPDSYVLRGEAIGRVIDARLGGTVFAPLKITRVTLSGTTFVATFSHDVTKDTSINAGSNLNTSFARDGFEWVDNGSFVQITNVVYSGNTATGTLASTPVGTIGQQELRIARQATTSSLTAGITNIAGSVIRKTGVSYVSDHDASTVYDWAVPQHCSVEAA